MRPTYHALLLVLALALAACGRTTTTSSPTPSPTAIFPPPASPVPTVGAAARRPSLGEPFALGVGDTAYVDLPGQQGAVSALALTFEAVLNDSRCPRLVQCVVAGDATILVTALLDGRAPEPVELHTSPQPAPPLVYAVYVARLIALTPLADQPSDTIDEGAYRAQLVVTRGAEGGPTAAPVRATP